MRRALLLVVLLLLTAACSEDKPQARVVQWSQVKLPAEPIVLAGHDDQLLVGLRDRDAKVVPRLLLIEGDRQSEVKLSPDPSSPYAALAVWKSVAYDGRRVLALGGAAGGAHSNVRWTVWTGTTAGVQEHPQEFNTFGGPDAGALHSAVIGPAGQALLGSWASKVSGLDGAVWLPQGAKWIRQDSTGTVLRSTPGLLAGPGDATIFGDSIVQTGSQVRLAPNVVRQEAAVWRSQRLNDGWSGFALPEAGERSHGQRVTCGEQLCTVTGWVEGKLALWQFDPAKPDSARRLKDLPEIAVGNKTPLPPPVLDGDQIVQVVADGNQVKVLRGTDGAWTVNTSEGPTGEVTDARLVGRTLYLIAGSTLWTSAAE
ncbi:hypothetical protein BWI15_05805 [Kribbella sp. ALI-6-A]|uniref:hypothetical protein n=1 Tax=Kribbella sp. ALI-6-A TaxID=1933817 RepID=UPI00097C27D2|nr:hypothetical protein [Kribbella sp. ALI-6-A]ONI76790.1 hypothetical protein BWI15_05805 [Kribbella sp. ALI-6-A]